MIPPPVRETVLFICNHNAGRSQMAEALLRRMHGDRYETISAGTEPRPVNPRAVQVMAEAGMDISEARSKSIEKFRGTIFDHVVTLCDRARQSCPSFPGAKTIHHRAFPNPSSFKGSDEQVLAGVRKVRDAIREWLEKEFAAPAGRERSGDDGKTRAMTGNMGRRGNDGQYGTTRQ